MRDMTFKLFSAPLCAMLLLLAACTGSTVVTMTATPSSDSFITYRVGLVSVQLKTSSGRAGVNLLPAEATVDFTKLLDLSEVFGAPSVAKGTYTSAVITFDYSAAQIIYDDGSLDGVLLTPLAADGKQLGLAIVTVSLDPEDPIRSVAKQVGRLSLNFDLAASNAVDLSADTVTVTPMVAASIQAIDSKTIRIRGPLVSANSNLLTTGLMPFESTTAALGQLSIAPSDTTAYEIDGFVFSGANGQAEVAALPAQTLVTTFGTLSTTDTAATADATTATTATTTSTITFTASEVLVDSIAQGVDLARVSGVVTARSGNTIGLEDATIIQNGGAETLVPGTTILAVGNNTAVTFFGQTTAQVISPQQISVGSVVEAFGTASNTSNGQVLLDASAGRVRLNLANASGLVTAQDSSALTLNLTSLGGRAINSFDFTGSGAAPGAYGVTAGGSIDLSNAIVGSPVIASGFANAFDSASPNFTASSLLDSTTIPAELVIDWSSGAATPFTSFDDTGIVLSVSGSGIGPRHQIQIGSSIVDLVGLATAPTMTPNASSSTVVFSIGHMSSSTVESFNTYSAFVTQLQSELNGITLATRMTAVGQYTSTTAAFSASSITLFLNN